MANISSMGVGSGIDIGGLVQNLVSAERVPATKRFDLQEAKLQAKLSTYGLFKGALSAFQSSLTGLRSSSFGQVKTVSIANQELFSATASSIAVAGGYTVDVKQLAQAHSIATSSGAFSDVSDVVGTGTLTFSFGSYANPDDTGAFTQNADKATKTVVIDAEHQSLSGVRDAVNGANIGVTAAIIDDGNGYRLAFSSADTGKDNALEITVAEDPAASGLDQLTYTSITKNMTNTVIAQDAVASVNGVEISRSTNTISEVVHGVTLQLKKASPGNPTQLQISQDTAGMRSGVEKFVAEYNKLQQALNDATSYNPETKQAGILLGDSVVRSISTQMRQIVGGAVSGVDGRYQSLVDLGITTQRDGTLALDGTKLDAALSSDPAAVERLFGARGKTSDADVTYVSSSSTSKAGTYSVYIDQLAQQGNYAGVASGQLDFTVNPTSFALKIDGTSTASINITSQLYASVSDVAAEMQRQINTDINLKAKGITVAVTHDGSGYVITSSSYGSSSSVDVTSANTALGLSGGTSTVGTDVVGSIGGAAARGVGQKLTGAGDTQGMVLKIGGTGTGDRGSVVFTRGYADSLNAVLSNVLASDGLVGTRSDGLLQQLEKITEQRKLLDNRLSQLESRLTKQFVAMDQLVSQLRSTGDYLSRQLAALPGGSR